MNVSKVIKILSMVRVKVKRGMGENTLHGNSER